jgi:hypothetical protein
MTTLKDKYGPLSDTSDYDEDIGFDRGSEYEDEDRDEGDRYGTTFEQEKDALSRKDRASECASSIVLPDKNDKNFRKMKALLTPDDNFKYDIDKISQYLNENTIIKLSVNDRNKMCSSSNLINNVGFFNASAYIIGYWVTDGGIKINMRKWNNIFIDKKQIININFGLDYEKKANVYPADVLRYARYIITNT